MEILTIQISTHLWSLYIQIENMKKLLPVLPQYWYIICTCFLPKEGFWNIFMHRFHLNNALMHCPNHSHYAVSDGTSLRKGCSKSSLAELLLSLSLLKQHCKKSSKCSCFSIVSNSSFSHTSSGVILFVLNNLTV